jgi:H+-transporting ATPase
MIEVAAALSAVVRHRADLAIILTLLMFNAAVGFCQEHQAGNAIEELKNPHSAHPKLELPFSP